MGKAETSSKPGMDRKLPTAAFRLVPIVGSVDGWFQSFAEFQDQWYLPEIAITLLTASSFIF